MKAIVILVSLLFIGAVSSQSYVRGVRLASREAIPITELCTTSEVKFVCNEDTCGKGVVACTGEGKGIEFSCGTSFCGVVDGQAQCLSEAPSTCAGADSENQCLAEGIFPDPLDCRKYYYCTSDGAGGFYPAEDRLCPEGYVFDISGRYGMYCLRASGRYCVTANCAGQVKNILLSYPRGFDGQVGVTCRGADNPIPFRCDGSDTYADLSTIPVQCKLNCRRAGLHPYPGDKYRYYECVYENRAWVARARTCFRDQYFDATSNLCVQDPNPTTPMTTVTEDSSSSVTP